MDMELKEKILIADDSEMNQEILKEILGERYEYISASDGVQAVEALSGSIDIDLVLLDINMPKLDGFGVLDIMNQRKWIEEIPVIIISSENDSSFIQKAYDLGATDYINRPFNLTVVQRRVSNTLMLYGRQKSLVRMVEEQVYEREKTNSTMVNILSHAIEYKNGESGIHLLHVRVMTDILLRELIKITDKYTLSESDISMISTLSALHDIGKIGIPGEIINKPGKLTDEEFNIMKTHTTIADDLLSDMTEQQSGELMRVAHEICRWHHERWDGRGYPDGLKGDEIPISAQVVSMADVYDALTSERCYKKAFSPDTAINMILGGECGSFNPLLIKCLGMVAEQLKECINGDASQYDFRQEAQRLSDEMLERGSINVDDWASRVLAAEEKKSAFFARICGGIQFEYDAWLKKVTVTNWYLPEKERKKTIFVDHKTDYMSLLSPSDWEKLRDSVRKTTPENPEVTMDVLIPVGAQFRWHRFTAQTIWAPKSDTYAIVIGQFADIHSDVLNSGLMRTRMAVSDESLNNETAVKVLSGLKTMFDIVRIVDPATREVLTIDENGGFRTLPQRCYELWGRKCCCDSCIASKSLDTRHWMSKLEAKGSDLYFVISRFVNVHGRECALEIISRVDTGLDSGSQPREIDKTSLLLMNFYRDSLTKAYSRQYLDNFTANLENADGVAIIDVDRFKQINDTYGHPAGDEALRCISSTILSCIRSTDVLIRYGGDEFLLIFTNISESVFFSRLEHIKEAVSRTVVKNYPDVRPKISIGGVYRVFPLAEAIRQADKVMYKNKYEAALEPHETDEMKKEG